MVEVIDVIEKIASISVWYQFLILLLICFIPVTLALSGVRINPGVSETNLTLSFLYGSISMLITAVIAFALALSWANSDTEIENINLEVNSINKMRREIKIFGPILTSEFDKLAIDYLNKVITLELPAMTEKVERNEETELAYRQLWVFIYKLVPGNVQEEQFLFNIISQITVVAKSRRTRIKPTHKAIENPFWAIIIIFAAFLPLAGYVFASENIYKRDIFIGITTFVTFSMIILLGQLQFPYSKANLKDNSEPFISLLEDIKNDSPQTLHQ